MKFYDAKFYVKILDSAQTVQWNHHLPKREQNNTVQC